jgi:protein tyrosine/serine phosphatase
MAHRMRGIENFRDFGGCARRGGGRIRSGILYRSGHLHFAHGDDAAAFRAAGIAHVVDLRSTRERRLQPCAAALTDHVRLFDSGIAGNRSEAPDMSLAGAQYMEGQYRKLPFEPQHIVVFTHFFDLLAEGSGPVLIHCWHGADRTGVVAAVYRMALQGWDKDAARHEMFRGGFGYHTLWRNIPGYLARVDADAMRAALGEPAPVS